jgi:Amt family ammonium transporter
LYGNPGLLGIQLLVVVVTAIFSMVGTFVILKLVDSMTGLRVSPEEEANGLDLSQHNERAYS